MSDERIFVTYPDHEMSDKERNFFGDFVSDLRTAGYLVDVRPSGSNHTGAQINDTVGHTIEYCHRVIAFVDRQSTSVGIYLSLALSMGKSVLCLHHSDVLPTRTVLGVVEHTFPGWSKPTLKAYSDDRSALKVAIDFIKF